ncbi:sulfurtransferase [Curvibacter sp. CHRR-16]|uniref:rhodanese-like domain-containing protein n=1 Tax=Curvibacter sp. CHRR-16 TaxID=2835872 RepID=UPI001BDA6CAC|nr:rhodanese-like domain-containing protein [Curvibacter sp. CHRR-16]MBT0570164.1 sulfurtransferase [Curvibacter sp. CHRR-16]
MVVQITPETLESWHKSLGESAPLLVIDVREPHEVQFASVQAPGLEVLAIPMGTIPARVHELERDRPVACLCHHGGRSQRVAMFLKEQGFDHVANIAGGIDAWALTRDPSIPRY